MRSWGLGSSSVILNTKLLLGVTNSLLKFFKLLHQHRLLFFVRFLTTLLICDLIFNLIWFFSRAAYLVYSSSDLLLRYNLFHILFHNILFLLFLSGIVHGQILLFDVLLFNNYSLIGNSGSYYCRFNSVYCRYRIRRWCRCLILTVIGYRYELCLLFFKFLLLVLFPFELLAKLINILFCIIDWSVIQRINLHIMFDRIDMALCLILL